MGASEDVRTELRRLFPGDGEMARRIREFDWSRTPLGSVLSWPQSAKTVVRVMLDSRYAMWLGWGPDLTFFYNDAYAAMSLGPKHPWALGRPAREVWAEIWDEIGPRAESVFRTGQATWDEGLQLFLQRRGFAEETYHTFSYSPVPNDAGGVGGMLCVVTEETERTIGERRLRTLRELAARTTDEARSSEQACEVAAQTLASNPYDLPFALIYLVDDEGRRATLSAHVGVAPGSAASPVVVDLDRRDGRWPLHDVLATRAAAEVHGLGDVLGPLHVGPWPEPPTRALVLPMSRSGQTRLAGFVVAGISARQIFDDDYRGFLDLLTGHIAAAVANARAYEEERQKATTLEALDRAKTAFFSNVSHEFRTPLTLMLGPLEDALAAPVIGEEQRDSLRVAHRNSLRLLRLVNTLLDFSRIEGGRAEAAFEEVDLARYTAELVSVFRSATDRAGLTLTVACEPSNAPVFVDREMWEKIVFNLLSNAFKFTLQGGITVALAERDGAMHLSVRDTGTGIPDAELPHVFERFHRVRGAEGRTHEGSGIGLALVSKLVELHGGTVGVESELGRGSTFTLSIPTGSAHLPAERIGARRTLASTAIGGAPFVEEALRWLAEPDEGAEGLAASEQLSAVASAGARVLLADDNADMRKYVARLLRQYWSVETVSDGEEALAAIRASRPDLVLSDVMMPRLDGIELLRAIRADPELRTLPVILLSARAGEESRVHGLEAGADDYLIKPFSARELLARVNAHLEMARARAEAEARLRSEEARYRALIEASSAIVWRSDPTGAIIDAPYWSDFTGQAAGEYVGAGWLDRVHPDDREHTLALWSEAMRDKRPGAIEHRIMRPDGTYCWMGVSAVPILDTGGEIVEWIGTLTDIDARKRAELDRHRYVSLAANASEFLGMCDLSFRPFFVNQSGLGKVGLESLEQAQRTSVEEFFFPEDRPFLFETFFPQVLRAGSGEVEVRFRHFKTGEPIWMLYNVFVVNDLQGQRIGYGTFSRDITDRRAAEQEREQLLAIAERARAEAESANQAKDDFLAVLSHELRSPMNAMVGWLRVLKSAGTRDPSLVDRAVRTLERNIWQQTQVIDDLLDVSRIMSGKLVLEQARVDVSSVVTGCVESLRPQAESRSVALRLALNALDVEVIGDAGRLQQIVSNIVGNAIKFTEAGGAVDVSVERENGSAVIAVQDTGQGIPSQFLPHLFERFRQVDSSVTRRHGGLGLGLAIVKNLVALHGGEVRAESEGIGRGARFIVSLPVAGGSRRVGIPGPVASTANRGGGLPGLDVLLVEDDADSREALEIMLQTRGARVRTAESVGRALEEYGLRPPALLISDIGLPGEDGYALIRAIREREQGRSQRTVAIAISGFAARQDREAALRAGYDDHLPKPLHLESLLERVQKLEAEHGTAPSSR